MKPPQLQPPNPVITITTSDGSSSPTDGESRLGYPSEKKRPTNVGGAMAAIVATEKHRMGAVSPTEKQRLVSLGGGRRKMSSPATLLGPPRPSPIARRLSNAGVTAARKFSHGLVFGHGPPATPEIICQGRALCAQYIRSRLKRSGLFSKKCGLQRLRSTAALPGGYVVRQVLPDLISVGTELERLHPKVYTNVGRQISPLPGGAATSEKAVVAGMTSVAKELCRGHVTWPIIVSIYAVAGGLAVDCVRAGHPEFMTALVEAMATALEEDMAVWIAENGGWVGLCSYCKPPSPDVSLGGIVALLGGLIFSAFVVALVLRWYSGSSGSSSSNSHSTSSSASHHRTLNQQ